MSHHGDPPLSRPSFEEQLLALREQIEPEEPVEEVPVVEEPATTPPKEVELPSDIIDTPTEDGEKSLPKPIELDSTPTPPEVESIKPEQLAAAEKEYRQQSKKESPEISQENQELLLRDLITRGKESALARQFLNDRGFKNFQDVEKQLGGFDWKEQGKKFGISVAVATLATLAFGAAWMPVMAGVAGAAIGRAGAEGVRQLMLMEREKDGSGKQFRQLVNEGLLGQVGEFQRRAKEIQADGDQNARAEALLQLLKDNRSERTGMDKRYRSFKIQSNLLRAVFTSLGAFNGAMLSTILTGNHASNLIAEAGKKGVDLYTDKFGHLQVYTGQKVDHHVVKQAVDGSWKFVVNKVNDYQRAMDLIKKHPENLEKIYHIYDAKRHLVPLGQVHNIKYANQELFHQLNFSSPHEQTTEILHALQKDKGIAAGLASLVSDGIVAGAVAGLSPEAVSLVFPYLHREARVKSSESLVDERELEEHLAAKVTAPLTAKIEEPKIKAPLPKQPTETLRPKVDTVEQHWPLQPQEIMALMPSLAVFWGELLSLKDQDGKNFLQTKLSIDYGRTCITVKPQDNQEPIMNLQWDIEGQQPELTIEIGKSEKTGEARSSQPTAEEYNSFLNQVIKRVEAGCGKEAAEKLKEALKNPPVESAEAP